MSRLRKNEIIEIEHILKKDDITDSEKSRLRSYIKSLKLGFMIFCFIWAFYTGFKLLEIFKNGK